MKHIVHSKRAIVLTATLVGLSLLAITALGQVYTQSPADLIRKKSGQARGAQPDVANSSGTRLPLSLQQPTTVTQLSGNIVESYYLVKTGPGQYDQIGIHHLTLTDNHGNPVPSADAIMMLHGDLWPFDGAFGREFTR